MGPDNETLTLPGRLHCNVAVVDVLTSSLAAGDTVSLTFTYTCIHVYSSQRSYIDPLQALIQEFRMGGGWTRGGKRGWVRDVFLLAVDISYA